MCRFLVDTLPYDAGVSETQTWTWQGGSDQVERAFLFRTTDRSVVSDEEQKTIMDR